MCLFTRFEPAHCCGMGPLSSLFVPSGTFCCNYQCFPCIFEWPCPVLFAVLCGRRPFRQCNFIDVRDPRYSFFLHPALTRPCFSCFRVTFATGIHKNLVDPVYLFTRFEPAHCCGTGPLTSLFVPAGTFCCNYQCFPCLFEWPWPVPFGVFLGCRAVPAARFY